MKILSRTHYVQVQIAVETKKPNSNHDVAYKEPQSPDIHTK